MASLLIAKTLACRKRRIKCDEARPTCQNCTKSKRYCEGYNQRVVFKDPYGTMQGGQFGASAYSSAASGQAHYGLQQMGSSAQGSLQAIAPKPQYPHLPHGYHSSPHGNYYSNMREPIQGFDLGQHSGSFQTPSFSTPTLNPLVNPGDPTGIMPLTSPQHHSFQHESQTHQHQHQQHQHQYQPQHQPQHHPQHQHQGPILGAPNQSVYDPRYIKNEVFEGLLQTDNLRSSTNSQLPPTPQKAHKKETDDASIADSDDEDMAVDKEKLFGANNWSLAGPRLRNFSGFGYDEPLVRYLYTPQDEGLADAGLKTIFMHFIHVTSPVISLFERHPADLILRSDETQREKEFGLSNLSNGYNLWSCKSRRGIHIRPKLF